MPNGDAPPSDAAMIKAAKKMYAVDGAIEIDGPEVPLPTSRVSRGNEPGAYILAWVWVYDAQAEGK